MIITNALAVHASAEDGIMHHENNMLQVDILAGSREESEMYLSHYKQASIIPTLTIEGHRRTFVLKDAMIQGINQRFGSSAEAMHSTYTLVAKELYIMPKEQKPVTLEDLKSFKGDTGD